MHKLRFRQVHLDFHTSPDIPGIGEKFDKHEFQETLQTAAVDSITLFAVCHHGWNYNQTEVGAMHPNLKFDLLRAQFDACKEIEINAPVYVSAGFNQRLALEHYDWCECAEPGRAPDTTRAGFFKLCFNTPYLDVLCKLIEEAARQYPNCDGIFLDIIHQGPCCCPRCVEGMKRAGLDPRNLEDRRKFAAEVLENYYRRTTAAARIDNPAMPVFHNSGHISIGSSRILPYFSHLELESLPTGGWGYDHYPLSAAYSRNLGLDFLGMTGKFHTTWGEFGGFKHPNALRYECAAMIANNSKCSIGDQLHPDGQLDRSTYELIGAAYREVAVKEPWCTDAVSAARCAVVSAIDPAAPVRESAADIGAARMLLEAHIPFELLDRTMDFDRFDVLILPDAVYVDARLHKKLQAFLARGGKLVLSGDSGFDTADGTFQLPLSSRPGAKSEFSPDFVEAAPTVAPEFIKTPFVMYLPSRRLRVEDGESLGNVYDPYFNRNVLHFCSHQHTPYRPEPSGYAAGVMEHNLLYFAHPVFSLYRGFGAVGLRDFTIKALRRFLEKELQVETSLPSTGRVTLMEQPGRSRLILHLLYANTVLRGGGGISRNDETSYCPHGTQVEVIEELLPLNDVTVSLRCDHPLQAVRLAPSGEELTFRQQDGKVSFTVPQVFCHQMVELDYR